MKKELLNVQGRVFDLLTKYPKTRNNDMLLYIKFAEEIDAEYNQQALKKSFREVVQNLEEYHLPSFGRVGRARRKVQEKYPELRAAEKVKGYRTDQEEKYREYART